MSLNDTPSKRKSIDETDENDENDAISTPSKKRLSLNLRSPTIRDCLSKEEHGIITVPYTISNSFIYLQSKIFIVLTKNIDLYPQLAKYIDENTDGVIKREEKILIDCMVGSQLAYGLLS